VYLLEGETIRQVIDERYPVVTEIQLSELFEVADVADHPQPVIAQIKHLQFGQQLETLDLHHFVIAYISIVLLSERVVS
jgi:hypothetical protein